MIFNENGLMQYADTLFSTLNDINEIANSFNDLCSVCEYTTNAKKVNQKTEINGNLDFLKAQKMAMFNNDIYSSRQKNNLGDFDKKMYENILQAEDICKEYEKYASGDFEKIVNDKVDKYLDDDNINPSIFGGTIKQADGFTGPEFNLIQQLRRMISDGYSYSDIKKYLLQQYYDISDDPEHIKRLLHLRLNYNKRMVEIFKKMLEINYSILNLTKQQAEDMSKNIDLEQIKKVIMDNSSKFVKRNGRFYDLRELGFGVAFIQNGKTRLEAFHTLDHLLPYLVRYDVVFLTHGKYNSLNIKNLFNKEFREECVFFIKYYIRLGVLFKQKQTCTDQEQLKKIESEYDKLVKDMANRYECGTNDPMFGPIGLYSRWTCAPIRTESAGPFTDVNKLLRQCIKEARSNKEKYNMIGSKKNVHIMAMCCNPGSISIAKDISSQKDVHIHYGKQSVMPESAKQYSDFDSCYENIYLCEQNLKQFCSSVNINYNDDDFLNECYNSVTDDDVEALYEMSIKELWNSAVALAKKIWGAIVAVFKWVINFFKDIIQKIKLAIKDKDADVQDISYITMESAKVKHSKDITLGKAEYEIEKACTAISRSINNLEQQQTQIMKKINDDLERKSRAV